MDNTKKLKYSLIIILAVGAECYYEMRARFYYQNRKMNNRIFLSSYTGALTSFGYVES